MQTSRHVVYAEYLLQYILKHYIILQICDIRYLGKYISFRGEFSSKKKKKKLYLLLETVFYILYIIVYRFKIIE